MHAFNFEAVLLLLSLCYPLVSTSIVELGLNNTMVLCLLVLLVQALKMRMMPLLLSELINIRIVILQINIKIITEFQC